MRDDFPVEVRRVVAARVNLVCSRPSCRAPTGGPQLDESKALNVGVAAHIAAAAPGGARYDSSMTPEERMHANNAIWLCQTCAKLIDNDLARFTVAVLRRWKIEAEEEADKNIGKARPENGHSETVAIARAALMDQRFQMVMHNYQGNPKFMIDTFADLSCEEKAELFDRAILARKRRPSKRNPYRQSSD